MADDTNAFLGIGWSFPPSFNKVAGTTEMAAGEDDIRQSLQILLSTRIGERLLQPRYGCNLERFQFEPLDTTMRTLIMDVVRDAILYFEPRVVMETINLRLVPEEGLLEIEVVYRIPATNRRDNLVYPFYLNPS